LEIFPNLKYLYLFGNKLSSIPEEISNLSKFKKTWFTF